MSCTLTGTCQTYCSQAITASDITGETETNRTYKRFRYAYAGITHLSRMNLQKIGAVSTMAGTVSNNETITVDFDGEKLVYRNTPKL